MIKLEDINKEVKFDPIEHKYVKDGKELISTTQLISLYSPKFDKDGTITKFCAKREGISVSELKEKWKQINKDSIVRGKTFHTDIEEYIKSGQIKEDEYKKYVEQFAKIKFKGKLYSEVAIHSNEFLVGGTTDILELFEDNTLNLYDLKTSKRFEYKSKYGNLLYPLENYPNCEIGKFTIQMGIYQHILEEHGFKVKKITIYWINPQTEILESHPIKVKKRDIKNLLKHYKSMEEW